MMHRTRKEWAAFNPYFGGSMRSAAAPVFMEARDDIETLYVEIERLRALAQQPPTPPGGQSWPVR